MVDISNAKTPDDTPFNMAWLFYLELSELRKLKSKAFIFGDIIGYRDCLEEIYNMLGFRFNDEEKINIEKQFSEVNNIISEPGINRKNEIKSLLRKIDFKIVQLMNKYNMIFPKIDAKGGLGDLYKKYGLLK